MDDVKQRKRFGVMIIVSASSAVLFVVGVMLWYLLPIYAPNFVVEHSHWPGPVARAFVYEPTSYDHDGEIDNASLLRLRSEFKPYALASLGDLLQVSGEEQVKNSLSAINVLIEERTNTVGGFIVQMISSGRAPVDISDAPRLVVNLSRLLDHEDDLLVLQTLLVLNSLGVSGSEAVPALRALANSARDKTIRVLAQTTIQTVRTDHNMVNDVNGAVDMFKTLAE